MLCSCQPESACGSWQSKLLHLFFESRDWFLRFHSARLHPTAAEADSQDVCAHLSRTQSTLRSSCHVAAPETVASRSFGQTVRSTGLRKFLNLPTIHAAEAAMIPLGQAARNNRTLPFRGQDATASPQVSFRSRSGMRTRVASQRAHKLRRNETWSSRCRARGQHALPVRKATEADCA
jgi:hypothetical protein